VFQKSSEIVRSGVGKAFPCAAVAIGAGHKIFLREFFGNRQVEPEVFSLTENTLFDLASLSKLVSTTMVALKFIEEGKLSPDDNIGKFLTYTGNFSDCKIHHLLTHSSGMTAGIALFNMPHKENDALLTILDSDRCYNTGEDVVYSCMGYIVLQRILEKISNETLDCLAKKYVFDPLGMKNACYNPDAETTIVAATELYPHTGEWATGHVHDENAYFLGGVAGNAGVFANLDDMISFAGMCSKKGIAKNGDIYLPEEIFNLAIRNYTLDKKESRGLGFQLKGNQTFPCGKLLSQGSYGHTGFTGTSLYVDYETGLWGILLTNAVHYGRENKGDYLNLRKAFYDTMITEYRDLEKNITK